MGRHREAAQQQLHHHSTQMGTNGPDDTAAVPGARHAASGQRGAARTCRATASTEQTNAPRRGPPTSQSHAQQQRSRTQMGTNGPDDAAAICGAACGASRQRGTGRTCRATASSEQTNAPPRGDRQPAKHPQLHGEKRRAEGR